MTPGDVSVVIPALNEADRIVAAIASAWDNGAGQVVVCDGGSRDRTVPLARQEGAVVVPSRPGRGFQLRQGARQASGTMLLFLHADSRLGEGCLREVCRQASQPGFRKEFWGGFRQQIDAVSFSFRVLEWGNAMRIEFRGMPFGDQAMFVTRALYDRVGGFQELPLMEDVVLSKALRRESWPLLIDRVVHVDSRRWKQRGLVRQTLRNWGIQLAHQIGVSEVRLNKWYR
jgi:rSAM/selenodomain-associated transferase 2